MRIGVIGCGFMAAAVVDAIAGRGHAILVSERGKTHACRLNTAYENVTILDNQSVLNGADVILIGLLADSAKKELPKLNFRQDHSVISLMSGIPFAELTSMLAPANDITIAIPFPFIASGGAPLLTFPGNQVATDLFAEISVVFELETEEALNTFMATQAVLSPVLKLLEQSANWMTERTEDTEQAHAFLRSLVGGSLMSRPNAEPNMFTAMLEELNTKGGLNAELREGMIKAGMNDAVLDGLNRLEIRIQSE